MILFLSDFMHVFLGLFSVVVLIAVVVLIDKAVENAFSFIYNRLNDLGKKLLIIVPTTMLGIGIIIALYYVGVMVFDLMF